MTPWSRGQLGALAIVLAGCLLLGWMNRFPALGTGEDEAVYVLLGESLADGHYRDIAVPGAPLHAKYPPGAPAWIAFVRGIAGGSLDAVRFGNLLLLALAGFLLADAWRRLGQPWIGIGAAAITLWNPVLLEIGTTLTSEPLFIILSVAAIWATVSATGSHGRRWSLLAALLAIAGFLTRTAGLGLLAGIGGWALLTRRWRFTLGYAACAGAVVVGWFGFLRWAMARTVAQTYAADLPDRLGGDVPRLGLAAVNYARKILPSLLNLPTVPGTPVDNAALLLILGTVGLVGFVLLARRWPASAITLVASGAILVLWGWPGQRLLLPLLPWIASAMLLGGWHLGTRLPARYRASVGLPVLLAVGLTASALHGSVTTAWGTRECRVVDQYATPDCVSWAQRALVEAARALGDSVPGDAVIVTVKPSTVHYFSRRTVIPIGVFVGSNGLERVVSGTDVPIGATHLLLTPFTGMERSRVAPIFATHCRELGVAGRFPLGAVLIALRRTGNAPDACEALRQYQEVAPPLPPD